MSSTLEHVIDQIGVSVFKYLNGILIDSQEADISEEYYSNIYDLNKTSDFFKKQIDEVCQKSFKAERRRFHLEYLSSAYLYFRKQLLVDAPFGKVEQKNFQRLFVCFLSSIHDLLSSYEPMTLYKITDELAEVLRAKDFDNVPSNSLQSAVSISSPPKMPPSFELSSFKYQKDTVMHLSTFNPISGTNIGTLGTHVNNFVFSLLDVPEKRDFLTQVIELTTSHCATKLCLNQNELYLQSQKLSAQTEELISLKKDLKIQENLTSNQAQQIEKMQLAIDDLKRTQPVRSNNISALRYPLGMFSMFPNSVLEQSEEVNNLKKSDSSCSLDSI